MIKPARKCEVTDPNPRVFTHRQLDDFVKEDIFVGKEVEHEVLTGRRDLLL